MSTHRLRPVLLLLLAPAGFAAAPPAMTVDLDGDTLPAGAVARLGSARFRPGEMVFCLDVSPDAKRVVTGGPTGGHVWDAATGRRLVTLRAPGSLEGIRFTADGRHILAVSGRTRSLTLDALTGAVLRSADFSKSELPLGRHQSSADGRRHIVLARTIVDGVTVRDAERNTRLCSFTPPAPSYTLAQMALSRDGKRAALVWLTRQTEPGAIDFRWHLALADAESGRTLHTLPLQAVKVRDVCFSPDGKRILVLTPGALLLTCAEGKLLRTIRPRPTAEAFAGVAVTPDGTRAAVLQGARDAQLAHRIVLYDLRAGTRIRGLGDHADQFLDQCFSPDGRTLYAAVRRGLVRAWDVQSGKEKLTSGSPTARVGGLCWTDAGRTVLTAAAAHVHAWDARTGRLKRTLGPFAGIERIQSSRDGRLLLLHTSVRGPGQKEESSARLIELPSGRTRPLPPALRDSWPFLSPDGRLMACGEEHVKAVRVWDVASGRRLHVLPTEHDVDGPLVFSPDARFLAAEDRGNRQYLWDLDGPRLIHRARTPKYGVLFPVVPSFAPNGRTLLHQSDNGTILLVETATGQTRWRLGMAEIQAGTLPAWPGEPGEAIRPPRWRVALWPNRGRAAVLAQPGDWTWTEVSPDGRLLATANPDGTVLIWDGRRLLPPPRAVTPPLTPAELRQCWNRLASANAGDAFVAVEQLAANPAATVGLLADRLQAPAAIDERRLHRLVADLDADDFATRRRAEDELGRLGLDAADALRRGLHGSPSLHQRRSIERLLGGVEASRERIALVRALEVLERCGTPQARALLQRLERQEAATWFRREVRAALARWHQ